MPEHELVALVDGRCHCDRCVARTEDIYRMVGRCRNCSSWVLMIFRHGDNARNLDCPVCGCYWKVTPSRLATADEIPAVVGGTPDAT